MTAPLFILPTHGARTYRGKFPTRARSVSHGATGLHLELNNGTRLWTAKAAALPTLKTDCADMLARAVPMSGAQYAALQEAAELLRTRAQIAGHGRRARLEERVRELVAAIVPDSRNYAKRNAERARLEILDAAGTRYGFDPARPFRVRNRTPQFSGSFDFATLQEAREYRDAQIARRDSVVSGAAPVGPDSNSQCPLESYIVWPDGTETLGDIGWTPPAPGSARWIAPAPLEAMGEGCEPLQVQAPAPVSTVRANLQAQAAGLADIAAAERESSGYNRDAAERLHNALEAERLRLQVAGNASAAELVADIQRAANTLLDRDAAALFARIRAA